jgi:peptidoglycan/xylan/chitin deacetylase (PgdA/CDA1 family)
MTPRSTPVALAVGAQSETAEQIAPPAGMRIDRSVSIHVVHPILKVLGERRRQERIPILMYHGIQNGVGARHPYFETATSPAVFERHMQFLSLNGYNSVTVSDAVNAMARGGALPKSVAITFDDGYCDFYTHALPILQKYGLKATMFVVSAFTTEQGTRRDGKEFMTWGQVREIHASGIEIGSHTVNHPQLYDTAPTAIERELSESKQTIEGKLSARVASFAYPYAFPEHDRKFAEELRESLQRNGYESGVSTIIGTARRGDDSYFLPRIPSNSHDDLRFFQAKLEGAYDWLHSLQYLRKRVKFNHVSYD